MTETSGRVSGRAGTGSSAAAQQVLDPETAVEPAVEPLLDDHCGCTFILPSRLNVRFLFVVQMHSWPGVASRLCARRKPKARTSTQPG